MIQLELQFIGLTKRHCPVCGREVIGRADKRLCSRRCYDKEYRKVNLEQIKEKQRKRLAAKREKKVKHRHCLTCGRTWDTYSSNRYCSRRCQIQSYRATNKEKIKEQRKKYRDANKEKIKKYWDSNRDILREKRAKYWVDNLEKCRNRVRAYRKANRDKCRKLNRAWKKNNPDIHSMHASRRRAKKLANGVEPTHEHRTTMVNPLTRQVCHYCGKDCTGDFHWDHFIPISKGGPDAPWNLVVSCPTCNLSKSDKLPESVFCDELGLVT